MRSPFKVNRMKSSSFCFSQNSVAKRLRSSLNSLLEANPDSCPTVAKLCEVAGVSRNSVYRYHRDILDELSSRKASAPRRRNDLDLEIARLRNDVATLKERTTQLATLVDRYYSAWRESEDAVLRLNREISEIRRANVIKIGVVRKD